MQKNVLMNKVSAALKSGLLITTVQAGTPLWIFEPLTATTLSVSANTTATVQYRITNQSIRAHILSYRWHRILLLLNRQPGA